MAAPAIIVENLSKAYRLGALHPGFYDFGEAAVRLATAPFRWLRGAGKQRRAKDDWFWALKDISLEIPPGEAVGLIGRNGAGKSTLLKILSRIVEPTTGMARLRGRVSSLLEVGTGFHPDLTGRENIYLNGAILGMRRAEIKRKFDRIVAFAEIEKFMDTPVKRYSTGMYVRLAFAVAAHLEPEIMFVDEVLAVGDAEFQKKCLGRMHEVSSGEGRTVLFVSHNMSAIESLCRTCCVLEKGRLVRYGPAAECIAYYLSQALTQELRDSASFNRPAEGIVWMNSARLLCDGRPGACLNMGGRLAVEVEFESEAPVRVVNIGLVLQDVAGHRLITTTAQLTPESEHGDPPRRGAVLCDLGVVPLVAGRYFVTLSMGGRIHRTHVEEGALSFEVLERDIWGRGVVPNASEAVMWWPTNYKLLPRQFAGAGPDDRP